MIHASHRYLPQDFLDVIGSLLPDEQQFRDFLAICQQPLRRSLRVNTLKISTEDLLIQIAPYGWTLTPIPWCQDGFWVSRQQDEALPLGSVAEHLSGLFYIQEASSMLPVTALFDAVSNPERVMDMAAAPGSKTTQIAASMNNQGIIIANEYSASRVKVLHANIRRCGICNTAITHFDGRVFGAALPESFDAILLDAPCSGEGVIRKDSDALRNWSRESVRTIAATQQALIDSAFHALKPGGTLIYSTCTLNNTENQGVIRWLQARYPEAVAISPLNGLFAGAERAATPEGFLHMFPQLFDSEGFFVARLHKTASITPLPKPGYKVGKCPFSPVSQQQKKIITATAAQNGLRWSEHTTLWQRDKELWLFPDTITPLLGQLRFSRIGLKLADVFPNGYRWQHEAVIALTAPDADNLFPLTAEQAKEWYQGRDIYPPAVPVHNEVIVTYQDQPLGMAKKINNRLKNSYPRELVRNGKLFHC